MLKQGQEKGTGIIKGDAALRPLLLSDLLLMALTHNIMVIA